MTFDESIKGAKNGQKIVGKKISKTSQVATIACA